MDTIHIRVNPDADKIEEIIDRAHSYEIYEEGVGRYRFVDRDNEIRKILKSSEYLFLGGRITVLYGSKGCGKSTLFKAVSHAVKGSDFEAILIETVSDAIMNEKIDKNKKVFIVADEVRIDSPGHLSSFRQWLEGFANELGEINRGIVEKGGRGVAVIALTSDALVSELRYVVGRKVDWALMWNLPRNASEEHISQIGLQHRVARELGISSEEAKEILWRLAGGNPRALGIIWKEGIKGWLRDEVINEIKKFTQDLPKKQRGKALEEISASLDKVDDIGWTDPSIWKPMLRHNIIIYIASSKEISEMPREQWIGREYAFQIPAYHHALKAMARKRSWDISPEEIIGHLR